MTLTKKVSECKDIQQFQQLVGQLKLQIGKCGGRSFTLNGEKESVTLNTLTKQFNAIVQDEKKTPNAKDATEVKARAKLFVESLEILQKIEKDSNKEIADLRKKSFFKWLFTRIKQIFGNCCFKREKVQKEISLFVSQYESSRMDKTALFNANIEKVKKVHYFCHFGNLNSILVPMKNVEDFVKFLVDSKIVDSTKFDRVYWHFYRKHGGNVFAPDGSGKEVYLEFEKMRREGIKKMLFIFSSDDEKDNRGDEACWISVPEDLQAHSTVIFLPNFQGDFVNDKANLDKIRKAFQE